MSARAEGDARDESRPRLLWCGTIFLVALAPRMTLVVEILRQAAQLPPGQAERELLAFFTPDTPAYLGPARRLLGGALLDAGTLTRPPGYPAFLALLGVAPTAVLPAQAVLGSVLAVLTFLLARTLGVRALLAGAAGLLVALLPSSVAVVGLIGPDLLLAVLFSAGLWLLLIGETRDDSGARILAAVAFACAVLVKPVMVPWIPLSVAVAWLFGRHSRSVRVPWRGWALLLGVQLVPLLLWAPRNYVREGLLRYSVIGSSTVRVYWMARAELIALVPGGPSNARLEEEQQALRRRFFEAPMSPGERDRRLLGESAKIFVDHPVAAARAFLLDVSENTSMGWDRFSRQLPATPSLAGGLTRVSAWEGRVYALARWTLLAAPLLLWLLARSPAGATARAMLAPALGLTLSAGFFVVTSGVTFWTGPRIVFPAVAAAVALVALATEAITRDVPRLRGSSEPAVPASSPS